MARCINPFITLVDIPGVNDTREQPVPCGKCENCLKTKVSNWSVRLINHGKEASTAQFVTLTYDTTHVPITPNGFMSLRKTDLQKFFKRLRKKHSRKISYFAVGEYGGKTNRPHYHIILFNAKWELLETTWGLGSIHIGEVSAASIGYCLKYISKPQKIPIGKWDDREKPVRMISQGIGFNYLQEKNIAWHLADLEKRSYIGLQNGTKAPIPRYYREKIYTTEQREQLQAYFSGLDSPEITHRDKEEHLKKLKYFKPKNSDKL